MSSKEEKFQDPPALRVGSLVNFSETDEDPEYEVVLAIYDDTIFHTLGAKGVVMQYNLDDVTSMAPQGIDITPEIDSIQKKLDDYNSLQ